MPKARKPITKAKPKSTAAKALRKPPDDFWPMPASDAGWTRCARFSRLAFAVLESDRYLLSSVTGLQSEFDEVAIALQKMSVLCAKASARIAALRIKAAKAAVRAKPGEPRPLTSQQAHHRQ
jgi:hypothetical protein